MENLSKLLNSKLIDKHNRHLNYLRISITDRCNLQCSYCIPRNLIPKLRHREILSYEEILRLIRISVYLGISKVRITGGEPLVRKGVHGFLEELTKINGLSDISLTTNGVFLKDNLEMIKAAGIKRINVSLDTLNRQRFKEITGHDVFNQVWGGIELAHKMGFDPIKLNVVVLKGINDDEFVDFARLTFSYPFHIRFIEYMPMGASRMMADRQMFAPEIKNHLSALGKLIPVARGINDGPAERFKFEGAKGEIGFICPISQHFCNTCNRLRLTASGQLRPCLLSDYQEDLKVALRKGYSDNELAEIILKAVRHKPSQHNLSMNSLAGLSGQMHAIGG